LLDLPSILFENQAAWRAWLTSRAMQPTGVWLKIAKKNSGLPSVAYAEALDEALCFGWIDGQKRTYDQHYFLQKFTPRRPKSLWSKTNVEKVNMLTTTGRMMPSGLTAVAAAKQDGRWERAYDASSAMTIPRDFQDALAAHPRAQAHFDSLNKADAYAYIWRLQTTANPQRRREKIDTYITMLAQGKAFH
jgi:uncharacterized protein YdeI (YjbR/CyaY-like superfamily)